MSGRETFQFECFRRSLHLARVSLSLSTSLALCHQSTTLLLVQPLSLHLCRPSVSGPHQSTVSPRTTVVTLNFSTLPRAPNYPFSRPLSSSPAPSCSLHQSCIQLTRCQSGPLSPRRPPTQDINLYQLSALSKLDKRQATLFALCLCPRVFCLPSPFLSFLSLQLSN